MQTEKVHFTKEKETMLVTLYGRALETEQEDPILRDPEAVEAVEQIDYDFEGLKVRRHDVMAIAARAKVLDVWVEEFLAKHPRASVLHLGCGLDSRVYRVNPSPDVLWFDVDYPEIIELRKRLFPQRASYQMIGSSVTDPGWLEQVPADRPAAIVAEGLLYYLKEEQVRTLVKRLVEHLPSGQIMFDAISRSYLKLQKTNVGIKATGARIWWGINNAHELEQWDLRIQLLTNWSVMDQDFPSIKRMSGGMRAAIRLFGLVPAMKNMGLMLRYRF